MTPDSRTSATLVSPRRAPTPVAAPSPAGRTGGADRDPHPLVVETMVGAEAERLLAEPEFQRGWDAVYAACPWRTVYQHRAFAEAWFPLYRAAFEPVVTVAYEPDGRIAGLLVLVATKDGRSLDVVGTHQSEYQTWLALPSRGNEFIAAALSSLARVFPAAELHFTYLAPGSPTAWCDNAPAWKARVVREDISRALRDLAPVGGDPSLRKRGNRSRLRQLERLGPVTFERVTDAAEFRELLAEFVPVHDARQGASHGAYPFEMDPAKAEFHERLFAVDGLLYVTVLRVGGALVAASIGVIDGRSIGMGPHTFSPLYSKQSPGKLLMHLLCERAAADGFTVLDMTPGPGWKERFATRRDTCQLLRVFFRRRDRLCYSVARARDAAAKRLALRVGTTPDAVRAAIASARRTGPLRLAAAVARRVSRLPQFIKSRVELDVHRMSPEAARAVATSGSFNVNDFSDLLAFRPSERWQTREAFLATAIARMGRGDRVYTKVEDGLLVACGWLAFDQTTSRIPEVGAEIELPPGSAVAYDFWSHKDHRGRGLHKAALRQVLHDAGRAERVTGVWMGVVRSNLAAAKNVAALGWPRHCTLRMDTAFGRAQQRHGRQPLHAQPSFVSAALQTAKRGVLRVAKWTGAFAVARALTANDVRILCYHGWELSDESGFAPRLFMKGDTFARRLDLLVSQRYRVIPLDQAVDGLANGRLPRLPVVITIDDGAASTALVAAKELAARRLPSTLYVTTYHVEKPSPVFRVAFRYLLWRTKRDTLDLAGVGPYTEGSVSLLSEAAVECAFWVLVNHAERELDEPGRQALGRLLAERLGLSWDEMLSSRRCSLLTPGELHGLVEDGVDLQLHTHRHHFPCNEGIVRRELEENRESLAKILPVRFDHLCYPSNEYYPAQFPWMRELGIRSATTCNTGLNRAGEDPYLLRRFLDGECIHQIEFEAEMSGFNDLIRRALARVRG